MRKEQKRAQATALKCGMLDIGKAVKKSWEGHFLQSVFFHKSTAKFSTFMKDKVRRIFGIQLWKSVTSDFVSYTVVKMKTFIKNNIWRAKNFSIFSVSALCSLYSFIYLLKLNNFFKRKKINILLILVTLITARGAR